jgi:hypothetical protein
MAAFQPPCLFKPAAPFGSGGFFVPGSRIVKFAGACRLLPKNQVVSNAYGKDNFPSNRNVFPDPEPGNWQKSFGDWKGQCEAVHRLFILHGSSG